MLTKLGVELVTNDATSERSTTALLGHSEHTVGSRAKALWRTLRAENAERKTNIQHVTPKEATAITGYGENGPKSNVKDGKGDKRTAAAVGFF
jgi:hypothetical protein